MPKGHNDVAPWKRWRVERIIHEAALSSRYAWRVGLGYDIEEQKRRKKSKASVGLGGSCAAGTDERDVDLRFEIDEKWSSREGRLRRGIVRAEES